MVVKKAKAARAAAPVKAEKKRASGAATVKPPVQQASDAPPSAEKPARRRPEPGRKNGRNHWIRIIMDRRTEALAASLQPQDRDAVEISGDQWESFGFKTYRSVGYPQFDICADRATWPGDLAASLSESADIVLAEQVWEHLVYPYRATQNVLSILRPGGYFLLSTPFLVRVHHGRNYGDCSRWTEQGMAHFLEECGFRADQIKTGSWGNRACAAAHINEEKWVRFRKGMDLTNEPTFPVQVWALARKT